MHISKGATFIILCSEYRPFMGGIALWAENLLKTLTDNDSLVSGYKSNKFNWLSV